MAVCLIFFLHLDRAATLLRYHFERLQNLAKQNQLIHSIYVDEFHQFLVEYGSRFSIYPHIPIASGVGSSWGSRHVFIWFPPFLQHGYVDHILLRTHPRFR
jgi:hypothetical protein